MMKNFVLSKLRSFIVSACIFLFTFGYVQAQTDIDLKNLVDVVIDGNEAVILGENWRGNNDQLSSEDIDNIIVALGGHTKEGIIQVNMAGDVLFSFGRADLGAKSKQKLSQIAILIRKKAQDKIYIIGHTDSKGSDQHNDKLSAQRAKAVMDHLHDSEGIPLEIMVIEGVGSRYPVAENTLNGADNPQGRAKNRRVEIQIATVKGIKLGAGVVKFGDLQITPPTIKNGAGSCISLCELTAGRHSMKKIACVEGVFEELGYDMDEESCGDLEDAMLLGMGNESGKICKACVREDHINDSVCRKVQATCF